MCQLLVLGGKKTCHKLLKTSMLYLLRCLIFSCLKMLQMHHLNLHWIIMNLHLLLQTFYLLSLFSLLLHHLLYLYVALRAYTDLLVNGGGHSSANLLLEMSRNPMQMTMSLSMLNKSTLVSQHQTLIL